MPDPGLARGPGFDASSSGGGGWRSSPDGGGDVGTTPRVAMYEERQMGWRGGGHD